MFYIQLEILEIITYLFHPLSQGVAGSFSSLFISYHCSLHEVLSAVVFHFSNIILNVLDLQLLLCSFLAWFWRLFFTNTFAASFPFLSGDDWLIKVSQPFHKIDVLFQDNFLHFRFQDLLVCKDKNVAPLIKNLLSFILLYFSSS